MVEPDPPELSAVFSCHSEWPKQGRGRGDSRFDLAQFKTRIVSDVLLLSYLDKIGLSLTAEQGKLWRFYIVKRGYIRDPDWRVFLSRLQHVLQATSPCGQRKSTTATHVEQ